MPNADITKRAIADTMKTLMASAPLAKISVGDIAKACGITRNSFYYHFQDKFDLVNWIFYTELTRALNQKDLDHMTLWDVIETICTFFYTRKEFYQNALSVTGQNSFIEYFNELLQQWIEIRLPEVFLDDDDSGFYIQFFANAFTDALARWLRDGASTPPEKYALLIRKAMTGAAIKLVEIEQDALP